MDNDLGAGTSLKLPSLEEDSEQKPKHLWDYWRIIWEGRRMLCGILGAILFITFVGTLSLPKIYKGEALVRISPRGEKVLGIGEERNVLSVNFIELDRYFNTEFVTIKSKDFLQKVVERKNLGALRSFEGVKDIPSVLKGMIRADRKASTYVAVISAKSRFPEDAAAIANAVAEVYSVIGIEKARDNAASNIMKLSEQLEEVQKKKSAEEMALYEMKKAHEITDPELDEMISSADIGQLSTSLSKFNEERLNLGSVLKEIEDVKDPSDYANYFKIKDIAQDQIIAELASELREVEDDLVEQEALGRMKDHPSIKGLIRRMDAIQGRLNEEIRNKIERTRKDFNRLVEIESKLKEAMESKKSSLVDKTPEYADYRTKELNIQITDEILQQIQKRVAEYEIIPKILSNPVEIVEKAVVPPFPVFPRMKMNLFVAFVFGLGIGLGVVFFLDYVDVSVKTVEDVEQKLNLPLLSVIPKYDEKTSHLAREAFQTLRTSLLFSSKGRAWKSVLVTSSAPKEGKSAITIQMAKTLAETGDKVLILEGDLRRPSIEKQLDLKSRYGLTDYLISDNDHDWKNLPVSTGSKNLYFLPSGPLPPNPSFILGQEKFIKLVEKLKEHYDWVIVDSPPVTFVSDSLILASVVDMIAMVIRHDDTDREVIKRALTSLRNVNSNIVGAILNGVDMGKAYNREFYYGRYYYGRYYDYTSEEGSLDSAGKDSKEKKVEKASSG